MTPEQIAQAACRRARTDLFFPTRGEANKHAMALCAQCPVRQPCLEYALADPEIVGIWGGTSAQARQKMRRAMGVKRTPIRERYLKPCGTEAAYQRHMRENKKRREQGLEPLPLDEACRKAHQMHDDERREARTAA